MRLESKLDKNNVENFMSLTSLQQGMLFHYIRDEQSSMYHEQLSLTIKGDIKLDLLQKAWQFVIENNEMLRTIFRWRGIEKPVQIVLKKHEIPINYLDFTNKVDKESLIKEVKLKDLDNRIDITRETLRICLCKLDENTHDMIISNHHILYDGWSNGIILKELMETYSCLYKGKDSKKTNKTKFSHFIKYLNSINKDDEKKYWSNYLGNLESKDDCFSCKKVGTHKEISYKIDENKANKIKDFSKENKVLLSSIVYGAWGVLLQKFNNSNEVLFGTTVSGRPENISSIDKMVGLFINTIPLRVKSDDKTTFIELINSLDKSLNERKGFENTSLIDIKEYCGLKVNEEIFNSIVTIENYPLDLNANEKNVLSVEDFSIIEQTNYNMDLEILTFDGVEFKFNFNSLSMDESIVEKLGIYLERIIENLLNNPNINIKNIDLLSEVERNQILYEFNDTKVDYSKDKTIHELFEAQVEKTPDNIAVLFEDKQLTYRELNEKSNQLARALRKDYNLKSGDVVAIHMYRNIEMIIGIIATIKAGAICLPIETKYPINRVIDMVNDSKAKLVLNKYDNIEYKSFNGGIVNLNNYNLTEYDDSNIEATSIIEDLAYLIYTSGSTGKPKAVMINNRGIINHALAKIKETDMTARDVCCHNLSFNFVASIWQIFSPLFIGSRVHLYDENTISDPYRLFKRIEEDNVSIAEVVPSLITLFLELPNETLNKIYMKSLRKLILTGEKVSPNLINKFYSKYKIDLINAYGQSECSDDTLHYNIPYNIDSNQVLIGKPTNNTKAYIIGDKGQLQPIGIYGELCISGDGVTLGYLNNPELTNEKFVDDPFELGKKMYRTGDLARWVPDGNIEFLGRIDNQVKIRGFRIELEEIENRILKHKEVKEVAVVVKENKNNEKYICAYIVSDKEVKELNLRDYLKESLPEYMIPAYFVNLEKMPLTQNGKINRRELPEPNLEEILNEYEAPRNEVEESLAKIWSEVLGVEKVGISDNFFELGGHSLKATVLMSKIHKELNKEIPLKELFNSPTIKELSAIIENEEENIYSSIKRLEEKNKYEISSAQKRMYMLQQFEQSSVAYNMPVVFELDGEINKKQIEETFNKLVARHESLRTYFKIDEGEIIQKIKDSYEFKLVERKEIDDIDTIINNFIRPFDLSKAPLLRVEMVENKGKTYLLIDIHHIISDGLSMSILVNELIELYGGKDLEPLKLQYKDFAAWQNKFLNSEEMKKQEEYWINKFNDEIPVLNMPTDYERPAMQSFEGDSVSFEVNEEITLKLRELTRETGTTMHMALLSAFNILLSKYSGQEDIVIGTPIAGRPHADIQNIMGMFVNTLALRNMPEEHKKYIDFLKEVKENSIKAYENGSYQLEALVEKLDIRRDISRNPLFDVMFNMIDTVNGGDIKLDDIILKQYNNGSKISKFDLTLNALESDAKINFSIEYCSKLFKKETIERLSAHYVRILNSIVNNVEIKLNEVNLLSEAEKNQILYEFNNTKVDYPKDKTIHELFEEQVEKTPNNIAVVFEDKRLTYRELNEKSNGIARVLRDKGVKADSIVGIMAEKSLEMIIGIMGILKAGGAYLPIDSSYPQERIEYMLKDSNSEILLSTVYILEEKEINLDGQVIDISNKDIFSDTLSNLEKINSSGDLAYVMYTSGTTGKPKGVMCEHKNAIRLVKSTNYIEFKNKDKILQTGSMVFDASTFEIWGALLNGIELYLAKSESIVSPELLKDIIIKNNITILWLTSELFNQLVERDVSIFKKLKYLLVGGDVLSPKYISLVKRECKDLQIINGYGPTENTTFSTTYLIEKEYGSNIPIGKPIANSKTYIVDKNYRLMPVGVYGELCVSGEGLARGYLNRPELTAEKFVDNPFEIGRKMYKTGDLARWLPDGNIEFLGRIDNQVKIRGFRIELGEIENILLQHEEIKEAVVMVKENKEKYICVYVLSEKEISELNLKSYLKKCLPNYMIPAYFIKVEKMPLTHNGKLDRRALPEPKLEINLNEYEAPRNGIEEKLSKIWSEVLGVSKVGINSNFFDLGGHSLKATVLMSKIHKELNREIPLKELFKSPTIKELSKYLESAEENPYSEIEKVEEKEYYEASSAQKRMYILQHFDENSTAYNMPVVFELEGKVNKDKIEEAFRKLTERHEALRTYFETLDGEIVQKLQKNYEFKLVHRNASEKIEDIIGGFVRTFDLGKDPLLRVELVENKEKTYLLIDMHHIISDGLSMNILIKEFTEIYSGKALEPLKLQYKDFAVWQNNFLKSEEMEKQEEYWLNIFNDEIPVLNMPTDYERPAMQSFKGDSVSFEVNEDITLKIRKLIRETGTTMHMVLLSAFNILLLRYSGQEDIVIGTPIAGRLHADLQNIMGMFVNTLALRNKPEGDKKYIDFLKEVKENSLKAYENQSYQLEALVEKLHVRRDTSRNPLFDVMFNSINLFDKDEKILEGLLIKFYDMKVESSKVDLGLAVEEKLKIIQLKLTYSTNIYNKSTIEIMMEDYINILEIIVRDKEMSIDNIILECSERYFDDNSALDILEEQFNI
ncbi:amino acid adenylation domain-containing protein [uncultured Clostridium sp.]|uniref:amino acid adenylation domain-containing protein n=3 Tax=Clostridium TaxID=1485 RepID=UPI003217DAF9